MGIIKPHLYRGEAKDHRCLDCMALRDAPVHTAFAGDALKRTFDSGATRDTDTGKPDYEGFLSPLVLEAYGVYMTHNRLMRDGTLRASDNWQKGIPLNAYMSSLWRHFIDVWKAHRGLPIADNLVWALCAILFNTMGYLHETIKADQGVVDRSRVAMEAMREKR